MNRVRSKQKSDLEKEEIIWQVGRHQFALGRRSAVMGILNVTPDSFSDGGQWTATASAVGHAQQLIAEGAEIIDVGGESTRPGSDPVSLESEMERVIPVIETLAQQWSGVISVDTSKALVARAALAAGASVINDITGLRDQAMVEVCAQSDCGVVVMHMRGRPKTMQEAPCYHNVVGEVREFFEERLSTLTAAGISGDRICWDPGIGFGKRLEDNLALLNGIQELSVGGRPVMMGLSRKSFIGMALGESELTARDWPTVGLTAWTRQQGALVHRVHEVRANRDALRMVEALESGPF